MRPLAITLFLLLACRTCALAQVQERGLMDRIMQPDMSMSNGMQDVAYNPGGINLDTSQNSTIKSFDFVQKFFPKAYDTKAFDAKDYWQGEFAFTTKAATVKTDSDVGKIYATKAAQVKDATESGKEYGTKEYATREAIEIGKVSQSHLDEIYKGKAQPSMDDIRDLLNKTHKMEPTVIQQ
jgi:hypothetical protein